MIIPGVRDVVKTLQAVPADVQGQIDSIHSDVTAVWQGLETKGVGVG
jgi:hypothetical protein